MSNLKHMSLSQLKIQKAASIKDIGKWQGKKNNEETRLLWINKYIEDKTVKEINWNEAPKEATHYEPSGDGIANGWMRLRPSGLWDFHTGDNSWSLWSGGQDRIKRMIARPDDNSAATIDEITQAEINAGNLPWNGEGLPPVGTECLFRIKAIEDKFIEYCSCTILFSSKENIVFKWERLGETMEKACHKNEFDFKPLQTKRDKLIDSLIWIVDAVGDAEKLTKAQAENIISSGYRQINDEDIKMLTEIDKAWSTWSDNIYANKLKGFLARLKL